MSDHDRRSSTRSDIISDVVLDMYRRKAKLLNMNIDSFPKKLLPDWYAIFIEEELSIEEYGIFESAAKEKGVQIPRHLLRDWYAIHVGNDKEGGDNTDDVMMNKTDVRTSVGPAQIVAETKLNKRRAINDTTLALKYACVMMTGCDTTSYIGKVLVTMSLVAYMAKCKSIDSFYAKFLRKPSVYQRGDGYCFNALSSDTRIIIEHQMTSFCAGLFREKQIQRVFGEANSVIQLYMSSGCFSEEKFVKYCVEHVTQFSVGMAALRCHTGVSKLTSAENLYQWSRKETTKYSFNLFLNDNATIQAKSRFFEEDPEIGADGCTGIHDLPPPINAGNPRRMKAIGCGLIKELSLISPEADDVGDDGEACAAHDELMHAMFKNRQKQNKKKQKASRSKEKQYESQVSASKGKTEYGHQPSFNAGNCNASHLRSNATVEEVPTSVAVSNVPVRDEMGSKLGDQLVSNDEVSYMFVKSTCHSNAMPLGENGNAILTATEPTHSIKQITVYEKTGNQFVELRRLHNSLHGGIGGKEVLDLQVMCLNRRVNVHTHLNLNQVPIYDGDDCFIENLRFDDDHFSNLNINLKLLKAFIAKRTVNQPDGLMTFGTGSGICSEHYACISGKQGYAKPLMVGAEHIKDACPHVQRDIAVLIDAVVAYSDKRRGGANILFPKGTVRDEFFVERLRKLLNPNNVYGSLSHLRFETCSMGIDSREKTTGWHFDKLNARDVEGGLDTSIIWSCFFQDESGDTFRFKLILYSRQSISDWINKEYNELYLQLCHRIRTYMETDSKGSYHKLFLTIEGAFVDLNSGGKIQVGTWQNDPAKSSLKKSLITTNDSDIALEDTNVKNLRTLPFANRFAYVSVYASAIRSFLSTVRNDKKDKFRMELFFTATCCADAPGPFHFIIEKWATEGKTLSGVSFDDAPNLAFEFMKDCSIYWDSPSGGFSNRCSPFMGQWTDKKWYKYPLAFNLIMKCMRTLFEDANDWDSLTGSEREFDELYNRFWLALESEAAKLDSRWRNKDGSVNLLPNTHVYKLNFFQLSGLLGFFGTSGPTLLHALSVSQGVGSRYKLWCEANTPVGAEKMTDNQMESLFNHLCVRMKESPFKIENVLCESLRPNKKCDIFVMNQSLYDIFPNAGGVMCLFEKKFGCADWVAIE